MIREVAVEDSSWDDLPHKFEAGTPNISGAIGLAAALQYIQGIGFDEIRHIDENLTKLFFDQCLEVQPLNIRILGPRDFTKRGGVASFIIKGAHPHDLATILDREGVCVRAGHHCAMPLHQRLGVSSTTRASFWMYNTPDDIEALMRGIRKAVRLLRSDQEKQAAG